MRELARTELLEFRQLLIEVLRLSRLAGKTIREEFPATDFGDEAAFALREKAMRAEAELLDRHVRWSDPMLFDFLEESPLKPHESAAHRAEILVKRVKARLIAAEKKGHERAWLLRGVSFPKAGGMTTLGFALAWAHRAKFEAPPLPESE